MNNLPASDPVLDFRFAYLRAVAQSWRDPAFKTQLCSQTDVQPLLCELFGLNTIWPNLDIQIVDNDDPTRQTLFKPVLTAGWIGSDDAFEIVLPVKPAADEAGALAAYYQLFPYLTGNAETAKDVLEQMQQLQEQKTPVGAALPTGLGVSGGGPDSLLAFGGVVLRAIALYWTDAQFAEELLAAGQVDAQLVLSRWLGYNNPFNFMLRFKTDPAFTWNGKQWNLLGPDKHPIKNAIVLNYPQAPDDKAIWPIALTSYNNTGPAYPFTC